MGWDKIDSYGELVRDRKSGYSGSVKGLGLAYVCRFLLCMDEITTEIFRTQELAWGYVRKKGTATS